MKKLLQRWLAMVLAVLMVMGTLPTSAWAARVTDDEARENPVLDQNDPVADTQGRYDDSEQGETPVDPIDPEGPPADLGAVISTVTLTNSSVSEVSGTIATGVGTGQDPVAVLIVPRFTTVSNGDSATLGYINLDGGDLRGYFNNNLSEAKDEIDNNFSGMPYVWFKTEKNDVALKDIISVAYDPSTDKWSLTQNGTDLKIGQFYYGVRLTPNALGNYINMKEFFVPGTANKINPNDGLPFEVFIMGSSGFDHKTLYIKVADQPLKVEIEDQGTDVLDDTTKMVLPKKLNEEDTESYYAIIKVTNQTAHTMNGVRVTLYRDSIVLTDPATNWGTTEVTDDKGGDSIYAGEGAYYTGLKIGHAYGFEPESTAAFGTGGAKGDYWASVTIDTLEPGDEHAARIPLGAPSDEVAFTEAGFEVTSFKAEGASVLGVCYDDTTFPVDYYPAEVWSNYTVEAKCTTGDYSTEQPARDSANGGIHWAMDLQVEPKVRLVKVNADGSKTPLTENEYKGTKKTGSMADNGSETHKLKVEGKTLQWNAAGYWDLGGDTATQGQPIYVDGVNTGVNLKKGYTDVEAYTVDVDEDGSGGSKDASGNKVVGDYTWDREARSRVKYQYYPVKTTVNVYAGNRLNAFDRWDPSELVNKGTYAGSGVTDSLVDVPNAENGNFTLTGANEANQAITAYYDLVNLKFFTTFKGTDINNTTQADRSRSIAHVHTLELCKAGETSPVASAVMSAEADDGYSKTGTYTFVPQTAEKTTDPWSITVPGGKYDLYINGVKAPQQIDTASMTATEYDGVLEKGTYHYVFELGGVTPKVENATDAGSRLGFPDDKKPGATDVENDYVYADKNTTTARTLFYPVGATTITPSVEAGGDDLPSSATYVSYTGGEDTPAKDAGGDWSVKDITVASSAGAEGDGQPYTLTFASATGTAQVKVWKNGKAWPNSGKAITISTSSTTNTASDTVKVYTLTETAVDGNKTGIYEKDEVNPNDKDDPNDKYYVFVDDVYVNLSFTVEAGKTSGTTVEYFDLTVAAEQTVDSGAKVAQSTSAIGTPTQNSQTETYLKNTTVNIKAAPSTSNYAFAEWTVVDSKGSVPDPNKDTTTVTMTTETSLLAKFNKPKYDTYLVLRLNQSAVTGTGDDHQTPSDADITKVELVQTKGGTTTRTTASYSAADRAWTVNAESAKGTGVWTITTTTGTYTATSNGDSTTPAEKDLYSVKAVPDSVGNDSTHQPKIDSKTRVILEAGGKPALAANPKNGFDYLKWVVVSKLGEADEAEANIATDAKYSVNAAGTELTLAADYTANAELVLRPKFTFRVPVELHYHTATGELVAGQTVTVDPGTGIKVAQKGDTNTGEFVISGMTTGSTYTVKVNGYASTLTLADTMASTTTAQKIVLHKVSAVSESATKGTVTLEGGTAVKYLPDGATDATGWAIVSTAETGYRVADTAWELTAGNTYGTLADATKDSTTLKVTTAIKDDVTATAYFTQQFDATIKIKIGNGNAATNVDRAYFTKEDGSGAGTSLGTPAVTATVDTAGYVVGHYVDADAQKLISWTVTGGKLYADAGKTTEIISGADSNVKTVYFFPFAAGATITANVAATYTLTYKDAWSAKTGATCPDAVSGLLAGNYTIPNTAKPTGAATGWSFNGWSTTGAAANKTTTVDPSVNNTVYAVWDVTLTWSANYGDTPATSTSTVTLGSNTTTPTNGTVGTVKADLTRTGYKFEGWYTAATGGDKVTASTAVSGPATYYAHWTENTARVTVTKNDAAYTGYNETLTLKASGKADIAGTKAGTPSVTGAIEYTFPTLEAGVEYTVYVGNTATYLKVTGVAGSEAKETLKYYDITLTNDDGKGYIALSTSALNSTLTADGTKTGTFLKGTQVNIRADAQNATNYSFSKWVTTKDGTNAGGTAPVATSGAAAHSTNVASLEAQTQIDAVFTKSSYNTQLHVTLNGKDAVIDDDITAVSCSGGTVSGPVNGVWTATAITKQETWTVTVRGGATYTVSTNGDMDEVAGPEEMPLYSVDVVKGDYGNDDSHAPYIGTDGITRKIVRKTGADNSVNVTLTPNPKTGFKRASWINAAEGATALPTGASVSGDTVTLADAYKPTDGTGLVLKPTFTFDTTVVTVHGTDPTDVTKVQLKAGTDAAITLNKETTGTGNHTGRYTATDLDPTKTYNIIVNDFLSTENVTQANAGGAKEVKIFSVTVQEKDKYTAALTPDGNAYVKLGANATSASVKSVYLPIGAKTTDGATDVTKVNLTAAVGTTNPKFRLWDKDDSTTDDRDETLWNVETITGVPTGKTMTAEIATTTGTGALTPNNLKVGGADGMQADVTVTAYFVRQYAASVSVAGNGNADTKAEFTDKQYFATSIAANKASATVDELTYVKAEFSAGTGDKLANWEFTGGSLYSALKADGTVDTTKALTSKADATAAYTTVYFVPSADNAKLIANVIPKKYTVMVTANLDNVAKTDATVELHYTEGGTAKVAAMTYNETDKVYKSNDELPFNTTYTIWTNIATQTTTTESAIKTIRFTAAEADAGTNLSEEVNYYTINLAVSPANADPVLNKVAFGTTMPGSATGTASKIFLAKAGNAETSKQAINIIAEQYNNATGTHYRFDNWKETKPVDGAETPAPITVGEFTNTPTKVKETYKLPGETVLTAKTGGNFNITPDNQITLTASFKQQFIVKVAQGNHASEPSGNGYNPWISADGNAPWQDPTGSITVDEGGSVKINATMSGTAHENFVFKDWTIRGESETSKHGSFAAGSTALVGYIKPGTTEDDNTTPKYNEFWPTADTVLELNLWKKATLAAGWVYDPVKKAEVGTSNPAAKIVRWTKNDGKATPKSIALHKQNGENWDEVTLSDGALTLKSGSQTDYVFADDYINALKNGTYRVTFTYEWADPDGAHTNKEDQTVTTTFTILATKLKLEEVNVGVRTDPDDDTKWAATANKNEPTRDEVWYKAPHKQADIDEGELVFTWYYANVKPTQKAYSDIAGGQTSLEQAQAVVDALAGKTKITTVRAWPKADAAEIDTGIAQIDGISGIEGKYVFAIVTIKDGSERAEGTVITNAIPVDYDAVITVNEDGDPVDETEAAGYAVYLWPTDGGAFDLDKVVDGKKVAIPTEYDKDTKTFKTKKSPLIGEKNYHVYVREVEGKDEQYIQHKTGSNAVVISRTQTVDTVDYYTVTLTDLGKSGWANAASTTHPYLEHFKDSANKEVGEAWDYANMPAVKAETSVNDVEVLSGKAVLKTTAVKATAKALTSEGNTDKAWLQDYNLDWYTDMTTAGTLAVTANIDQTNKTAITAGHTTAGITHATEITGKLKQNTYVIKGNVKDLTSGAKTGQIESDVTPAANKPVPTLTYTVDDSTSYVFKATDVTVNGGDGAKVTFKVPRSSVGEDKGAIVGTYFLEATPKSNPATTLKGYSVPTATEVPDSWTRNVDVAAGTTGAALNDRFTIFIESTSLTLEVKDEEKDTTHVHQRSGNMADTAATFNETTGRHNDTWKYNSKTASYTKQVIITNKGNTLLKVTPTLEKYTKNASGAWVKVASFSYTPADNAFEDNLGNNKMTGDPKKIGFSNWKTSYDLAANGGTEAIPVTIPANLENSDDVRYRFIFTSEDGRDGYTGTGPTLWFELETVVEPVEVTKVTTEHPGGNIMKYRVKTTTIAEDEGKTGTPNYDALQKPQENSGLTSGVPKADNDLVYEWYVADWDDTVTFNATDGKLYNGSTAMTPETKGVSKDTLTFDLDENADAQGRTLYLLVKGQHNAQGAATTPDVIGEPEPPMLMPYTGKIYIEEDTDKITAATGYKVYLWNKKDGTFDPDSDEKIEATWVAPAEGKPGYFAASNLYAADPETATTPYTYEVWTNTVKGTTTVFQNSNQTVTGEKREATVVYHSVTLNNTTVDNAPYNANFTVNSDLFFRYVDGTTVTEIYGAGATDEQKKLNAPTAKAGAIDVATSETNKWVQTGTSVTATYPAWTKDYALTWDSDTTAVNTPTTASTKTYTVNDETEVDTQLKLNIYDVVANVNGTTGKVAYFTMVLTDGEQTYTFTSKTDSPDGDAILGVDTTVSEIVAGGEVVFKLPAAGPYVTKAKMPADTAAKLISYTNTDNSETEVTEGQEETTTIDVVVPVGGAEYAANLQGDGVSISFADNIPAATTIDGVNLETSGAKSQNGNAGITPKEGGVEISKKEAVQTIHLNYHSYTSAIPVEISFTNKSKYDSSGANDLKEVTFTKNGTTTAKPGGGDSITIDASSELSATGIDMVSNADAAHPEVKKVVLNIQPGLHVGTTYTFKADVAFKDNKTPQNSATTSYTLNVIIDPLPITSLTIDKADNGDLKLTDYNATTAPNGGVFVDDDNNAATPAVPMSTVNFQAGDVSYVWAKAPVNISVDKNSFAMTTGATNTITATADDVTVTSETGTTLSAANIEPGVNYYLIAYSAKNTSNAADFAVSPAFKTTYPGIVYLNVNGDLKQGKDDADSADGTDGGAYKVVFINKDTNDVVDDVTWKEVSTGVYAYVADLTPNTAGYTAKISRAKGDLADAHLIALDKTIKGEPTIGTADTDANVVVANFFTVNPVPFTAAPYQTGTGEKFDYAAGTDGKSTTNTDIEPKFAIGTGADKADLADVTPTVLSGQTVTATAPETTTGSNIAWTQDYLLTWQADDATGADDTFADANDKTPKNVSADNAVKAAGAYSQEITAKTYIGGRLDQKTYTVVGTVKGTGGYVGKVDMAFKPATGDTRSFTLTTGTAGTGKINDNFKLGDEDGDGIHGEPNDTVTFKVVKGAYEITAFDGAATGAMDTPANAPASTVLKVTVGAAPDELDDVSDRSKETLGGNAPTNPDVTANGRVFTMYVAGTDLKLGVDDDDAATPATSNAPQVSEGAGNVANNNKHADNVKTYYFNSTSTTPIGLTLSNPGNADLKVKAEVFRFGPTDTVPNYATGSWTGGTALDKDHTYKDNATGSVVTIASSWETTGADVAVGAGVADSGVDAVNAGSITLTKTAPNTADAVYIVRFTSTYVDNNSATPMTGPTVYYVLDLTVNPLPIVSVSATPDANGTMRLENFVSATEATAEKPENDGLDSVLVDHDGDGKTAATGGTDPMGAKLAGLAGADISYAWYTAPVYAADGTTPVTVDKSDFQFNAATGALELTTAGAAKGLTIGAAAPGDGGKTYKPTDAEQGRNVYLVAYRASTTCNAADLAVSAALYAQVTIKLEARRTDDVNAPGTASPLLSTVQIEGTYSEQTAHSNTDGTNPGIVVNDRDNRVIAFTGDMNDYLHGKLAGTEDKPNDAKWYFVGWNDSDGKTPSGNVGTFTNQTDYTGTEYTVAAQATVIGYYDKLPELKGKGTGTASQGYSTENTVTKPDVPGNRTFVYDPYDGGGDAKVEVWIVPQVGSEFKTEDGNGSKTAPRQLNFAQFDLIAGNAPDPEHSANITFGKAGDYQLKRDWIKDNLNEDLKNNYDIIFYDLQEGSKANGYEGYDRVIHFNVIGGEKTVNARVKNYDATDATKAEHGKVTIRKKVDDTPSAAAQFVSSETSGGGVVVNAIPDAGYVFNGWTVITEGGGFFDSDAATVAENAFHATKDVVTVEASFRKANLTKEDGHAKIYYGTQRFVGNTETVEDNYKDLTVGTSDTGVATDYAYTWLTGADLKTYLTTATADGGLGMSEADADILVAKTETARYKTVEGETSGWLEWHDADVADNENKFVVKAAAKGVNVEKDDDKNDVGNELVVYVKATEQNSEQDLIVSFTIDIMTSTLAIRTDGTGENHTQNDTQKEADGLAYKTKYVGVYGTDGTAPDETKVNGTATDGKIIHGNAVEREWFEFISIDNVSDEDKLDHLIEALTDGNKNNAGGATGENGEFTYVVTDKGVWKSVVPPTFNGAGSADENEIEYTFEFHYTGAEGVEDDYNYSDASIKIKIPVQRPQRDLLIADEVTDYTDLKRGDTYSDIEAPLPDDGVTTPTKLLAGHDTKRLGESITYLDEEPVYTAKLQRIGAFDEGTIKLELDPEENKTAVGFVLVDNNGNEIALNNATALKALLDAAAAELDEDGTEATIKLKLAPVHDKVWVGEHYIRFKLSGVENGETVEAHYTLSIEVAPKVITKLDVTVTDPETEPDEVTGTTEDGTVNNKDKDDKENIPIKDVTVTWGPEENKPDGKNTEVKVKVEIDPNYVYVEDDENTDPNEDITENTEMTVTGKLTPDPVVIRDPEDGDHIVHITQKIPYLMHDDDKADGSDPKGPAINHSRTVTVAPSTTAEQLGKYTINLGAYGGNVYDVQWTVEDAATSKLIGNGEGSLGATLGTLPTGFDLTGDGAKQSVELDLTTITGKLTAGASYSFTLKAIGKANDVTDEEEEPSIISLYTFTLRVSNPPTPGGGGSAEPCPCKVLYHIGLHGTTTDATIEDVSENNRPVKVPAVTALDGYVFRGWSLSNPATLKKGEKPVLVDPKTVDVKGESMIFYAVIVERPFHEHYVIGYPNGNFGPADDIDRASVATIIARAILPDFKEGANYGNPGKYTDVSGHWAESAIAYCSKFGVFEGYTDGTFKPNQPITRQEFALVIARLDGVMTPGEMDFTDIDEAGPWALGGIYTAYEKGWVNGYTDGTFKPLNNIRRDEAVKVFNAYLNRGVDADGLAKLHEYVHSGVASNVTGNGTDEYMTWPDVPQDHWAYYEIVEAANDHEYEPDFESELGYTLPETWDKCWIDERWRYHDDINDGGPNAALVSAGFRVWLH